MSLKKIKKVLLLGTGGTIAGLSAQAGDLVNYAAAQVGVSDLLHGVRLPGATEVRCEQVAQVDSKDMGADIWRRLLQRLRLAQDSAEADAVVITHGTDTVEETAFLLACLGPWRMPLVLTCAMRPANAPDADGPGNLADALAWAVNPQASGVSLVCAGHIHEAWAVQKAYTDRVDAFRSGDSGPWGVMEEGQARLLRPATSPALSFRRPTMDFAARHAQWPRVSVVMNHADADGWLVDALLAHAQHTQPPLRGVVLAGTGNGSASVSLVEALVRAQSQGVEVWRASRCAWGVQMPQKEDPLGSAGPWSAVKARVALTLHLLAQLESA